MRLIKAIKNFYSEVKSRTYSVVLQAYSGVTQWVDAKFETYANEGYKKNLYVYSAIRAVSKAVSTISVELYRTPSSGVRDKEEIPTHPLLNLLNNPNPTQSRIQFFETITSQLLIYGNVYIEGISTSRSRQPKELYLLRPDRVSIVPETNPAKGLIKSYIYTVNGINKEIPASNILHIKLFNPTDDLYGLSPIQVAGLAIDQNNLTKGWNIDILNNGGMASGSLSTTENLTEEQFHSVERQMNDYNSSKKGKTLILSGGLKYERFSMSAEDMSWLNASKMSAREICIIFGVPPEILGDSTNKTYNNYAQARKAFYEETVIPTFEFILQLLGMWLFPLFNLDINSHFLTFNKDDIEAIQEDREKLWKQATNSFFLTINERRALVRYGEVENGNVYVLPNNLRVVEEIKEIEEFEESMSTVLNTEDDIDNEEVEDETI